MKRNKIGLILVLMLFVGVCVLLYPSVSQYWNTKTQTRAVENYREILDSLKPEDFDAYFNEADEYNKALGKLPSPLTNYQKLEGYNDILNVSGKGIMGYWILIAIVIFGILTTLPMLKMKDAMAEDRG